MLTYETMDARDWRLLKLLASDARLSYAELGRRLKLTPPAVAERLHRLEDAGIIEGYGARVNVARLGRGLRVFLRVQVPPREYARFQRAVQSSRDVEQCHHVTGGESHVIRAALRDVAALDQLIQKLSAFGPTVTSVVLSTQLERQLVDADVG